MSNKFDELAKGLAQSVTRRQALKKFGVGLGAMALACFGLANRAEASQGCMNKCMNPCVKDYVAQGYSKDQAHSMCLTGCISACWLF